MAHDDIEIGGGALPPNESTPLVGVNRDFDHKDDNEPLGEIKECTNVEAVVGGAAAVAASLSFASMIIESNPVVLLSGTAGIVVPSYSAFQEQKLTDVAALIETNERMEKEVSTLKEQNIRLDEGVNTLELQTENLKDLEETLETIRESETKNVALLEKQLADQRKTLDSMKVSKKNHILSILVNCLVNIDKDKDYLLSDEEINGVIKKVEKIMNVDINDEMLKALIIGGGRSLNAVMAVAKNLVSEDIPEDEKIFTFLDDK